MATSMQGSGDGFRRDEVEQIVQAVEGRHGNAGDGTLGEAERQKQAGGDATVPLRILRQRNEDYDPWYWRRLRALYSGGKTLLGDKKLLEEIFPPHRDEHEIIYHERLRRAFYTPYANEIVGHLVSALFKQPVTLTTDDDDMESSIGEWWGEFYKDCSPKGGKKTTFMALMRQSMLTAQQTKTAWVLVDLPSMYDADGEPFVYTDRKAQEDAGALDAYVVCVEPESVIDWECDDAGRLEWAIVYTISKKRDGLLGDRKWVTHCWTYYDRDVWQKFELRHHVDKEPKDTAPVPMVDAGTHGFGEVPLVRLELPDGLWTMEKLEGLAREHFNKRSGLAWGELQSLLPELYEFNGPEESIGAPVPNAQEAEDRSTSQPRGQGFVQVRGHEDRAEFIGPDVAPFTEARNSCNSLRDEMHRVTHQMALSVDNNAAAIGRSGDSKAQDAAATSVVLGELGRLVREFAEEVYRLVAIARGETELAEEWEARGMEKYDGLAIESEIEQALAIDQLNIESPTFRRRHRFGLVKLKLGDDATQEDLDAIETELERNIADEWEAPMPIGDGALPTVTESYRLESGDDDDDDDDDETPRERARRTAQYSSPGMR